MAERQHAAVAEAGEIFAAVNEISAGAEAVAPVLNLREDQLVVRVACARLHRHDEARMPAAAERHHLVGLVFDNELRGEAVFAQRVDDVEREFKRVGRLAFLRGGQNKLDEVVADFLDRKLWVTGETVLGNRVGHAVDDDVVILRRAADREEHRRMISPDSRVSLPNNLAVIIPLEGGHLRALLPDACGRITAVKRKFHEKHLRKCRFRRKYSRHEAKNPA